MIVVTGWRLLNDPDGDVLTKGRRKEATALGARQSHGWEQASCSCWGDSGELHVWQSPG